jgi:hypothetical protein
VHEITVCGDQLYMKVILAPLLLILFGVGACAKSEPAYADADDIEASVKQANEQAAASKDQTAAR